MGEGATVGEGDELSEGVGPLRTAEKSGMTALRADKGCRLDLRSWQPGGEDG